MKKKLLIGLLTAGLVFATPVYSLSLMNIDEVDSYVKKKIDKKLSVPCQLLEKLSLIAMWGRQIGLDKEYISTKTSQLLNQKLRQSKENKKSIIDMQMQLIDEAYKVPTKKDDDSKLEMITLYSQYVANTCSQLTKK